ncbi:hypothetical protein DPX16_7488 [Anabarilius grahami]|uniref:Uncharacterized protein n=1 Tax=Anabarilius grahami TaxID=495550 RepID=A0A3N0ZC43_ANAGA|nr:hypothetical protein DPX16_7488 [Anabarilius grahami]
MSSQEETQNTARTIAHDGVEGVAMVETWLMTPSGQLTETKPMEVELKSRCDINGSGDRGGAAATSVQGGARVHEDRDRAGGTEDQDRTGGKAEPNGAKEVEGQSAVEGPEVHGAGRLTSDQGEAGGMQEPSGAVRVMVPGGVKGGRSHGGDLADDTKGTTDGDNSNGGRAEEPDEPMRQWVQSHSDERSSAGRVTSDQGGAGEMRESSGAVRAMVPGGAEGLTGRGGVMGLEAGGGARASSWLGGDGDWKTQGTGDFVLDRTGGTGDIGKYLLPNPQIIMQRPAVAHPQWWKCWRDSIPYP